MYYGSAPSQHAANRGLDDRTAPTSYSRSRRMSQHTANRGLDNRFVKLGWLQPGDDRYGP